MLLEPQKSLHHQRVQSNPSPSTLEYSTARMECCQRCLPSSPTCCTDSTSCLANSSASRCTAASSPVRARSALQLQHRDPALQASFRDSASSHLDEVQQQ